MNILLDNALQHCLRCWKKTFFFYLKKMIHYEDGDGAEILKPVENGDEIQFIISVEYE